MSRYTRGKWRAMLNCEGSYSVFTERGRARRRVHAECFTGDYSIAPQEAKANARLIAHAPEMYGYLVQIVNDYDLDPDLEGDIMWMLKEINGGQW